MSFSFKYIRFIYSHNAGVPIHHVAFYACIPSHDDKSVLRDAYAEYAAEFAKSHKWDVISPVGDTCYIEIAGESSTKRPVLDKILRNPQVDTIALVSQDKFGKKGKVYQKLVARVAQAGKNLIIMQNKQEIALEDHFTPGMMDLFAKGDIETIARRMLGSGTISEASDLDMVALYGSLYMDAQESWEYAEMQIDEMIEQVTRQSASLAQVFIFFDIVATQKQLKTGAAHQIARHLLSYIDTDYPDVRGRMIGITDDDDRRPMRDIFILEENAGLTENDIDGVHLFMLV